jgi:aspartyl protease family protein
VGVPTPDGVKLLAIDGQSADFEVDGRRQRLTIGQQSVSAGRDTDASNTITLTADPSGHFFASGTVNGAPMRFIVDTGASTVALGKSDAIRANVDYQNGQLGAVMTASGLARVWRVKLNSVRVGTVILSNIEATVHENDLPIALLGMSFLNRMEMKRDGVTMVLKKRY